MSALLVLNCIFAKQLWTDLHKQLEGVVDEAVDGSVPMGLAILVERGKHDGQDHCCVVANQIDDIVVVPVVKRPLSHLYNFFKIPESVETTRSEQSAETAEPES